MRSCAARARSRRAATAAELSAEDWNRTAAITATLKAELAGAPVDALYQRLEGARLTGDRAH
jgi:hypothetical protein